MKSVTAYSTVYMKTKQVKPLETIIKTDIIGKQKVVRFRSNASAILQKLYERPKTNDPLKENKDIIKTAERMVV